MFCNNVGIAFSQENGAQDTSKQVLGSFSDDHRSQTYTGDRLSEFMLNINNTDGIIIQLDLI
jgi:hypothetical protein